jgi:hypothetical protein
MVCQNHWKQVVYLKEALHHQNERRGKLACAHQHVKAHANQLSSIEVKIKNEDM